mmetsp:Transcript_78283/g.243154  ORF Transcript_78283/g.243154 Transcript_78283/m.243154 type:complete len:269 (+) Transcript_78283:992-1798(+)
MRCTPASPRPPCTAAASCETSAWLRSTAARTRERSAGCLVSLSTAESSERSSARWLWPSRMARASSATSGWALLSRTAARTSEFLTPAVISLTVARISESSASILPVPIRSTSCGGSSRLLMSSMEDRTSERSTVVLFSRTTLRTSESWSCSSAPWLPSGSRRFLISSTHARTCERPRDSRGSRLSRMARRTSEGFICSLFPLTSSRTSQTAPRILEATWLEVCISGVNSVWSSSLASLMVALRKLRSRDSSSRSSVRMAARSFSWKL